MLPLSGARHGSRTKLLDLTCSNIAGLQPTLMADLWQLPGTELEYRRESPFAHYGFTTYVVPGGHGDHAELRSR